MRVIAGIFLLAACPAAADDYAGFQSPTGNIHCAIYTFGAGAEARCDLRDLILSPNPPPPGCELDWGSAFVVPSTGSSGLACVGDTMLDPGNPVLPYGEALSLGGITCVSARTGMTCTNAEGHGFSVARARQDLF